MLWESECLGFGFSFEWLVDCLLVRLFLVNKREEKQKAKVEMRLRNKWP